MASASPMPPRQSRRPTTAFYSWILPFTMRTLPADLPEKQAEFEAHSQALTAAAVFTTPAAQAAWKTKPSWYAVAKADRIINPDLERMYAERAHSHTIEVEGASHSVYESHAKEVAALIEDAARHALAGK